jgi:hypothetical protein
MRKCVHQANMNMSVHLTVYFSCSLKICSYVLD